MKNFGGVIVFLSVLTVLLVGFFGVVSSSPNVAPICVDPAQVENVNEINSFSLLNEENLGGICTSGSGSLNEKKCRASAKPVDVCDTTSNGTTLCGSNSDQACVYQCICKDGSCSWTHKTYCASGKCDDKDTKICKAK